MSNGKQIAIFMSAKDLKRLEKLVKLITPLRPNRSMVVQKALLFADMNKDEFTAFVQSNKDE